MVVLILAAGIIAGCCTVLYIRHAHKRLPIPINEFAYLMKAQDSTSHRYVLLSPYMVNRWWHGRLVVMDMAGNIVLQRYTHGSAFDFRKWKIDGKTRYTWFINDQKAFHIKDIKLAAGNIVLADSTLTELKRIYYVANDKIKTRSKQGLDPHDLILLSDDHYITMSVYIKEANNIPANLHPAKNARVAVPILQEVKDGKLVWQWDASDYPALYASSVEHNHYFDTSKISDYLHINAAALDPHDSNLVCSFRNSDQVIKIDRKDGHIIWKLGGKDSDFPLTAEQHFLRQHDVHFTGADGHLILLDNGDSATRPTSRVLEITLNEKNKTITAFSAYTIPEPYAQYMGSVEKLGDTYFIGGGTANFALCIDPKTGGRSFEYTSNLSSYRAYFIDDITGMPKQ